MGKFIFIALLSVLTAGCSGFAPMVIGGSAGSGSDGGDGGDDGDGGNNGNEIPQKCDTRARLSWIAPTANKDGSPLTDLAGYKIYYGHQSRGQSPYSDIVELSDPTAVTEEISDLDPAVYYFAITAVNTSGVESEYSKEAAIELVACQTTDVVLN